MQCCATEGLLTDKSAAFAHLLCTHQITLPEGCLAVGGPVNNTVTPVFNGPTGFNFRHIIDWSSTSNADGTVYSGQVTLDYQGQRCVHDRLQTVLILLGSEPYHPFPAPTMVAHHCMGLVLPGWGR